MNDPRPEFDELAAGFALGDLTEEERAQFDALRSRFPDASPEELELLVGDLTAALAMADAGAMPPGLKERVIEAGEALLATRARHEMSVVPGSAAADDTAGPAQTASSPGRPASAVAVWSGWAAAAAVTALWLGGLGGASSVGAPDVASVRSALMDGQDAVEIAWTPTEDPAANAATGDVVWSNASQSGVMRFVGLEPNDPAQLRYQLWIFDGARDERYPVDGGLFDIAPGATEVLVPVDARLAVVQPTLFAVTVERPDGVVVSDRERIVVVAPMTDVSQAEQ